MKRKFIKACSICGELFTTSNKKATVCFAFKCKKGKIQEHKTHWSFKDKLPFKVTPESQCAIALKSGPVRTFADMTPEERERLKKLYGAHI